MKDHPTAFTKAQRIRAYLALLGVVLFWGLNFPIAKHALAELPPTAFNALRFPIASIFIFVVMRVQGNAKLPRGRDLRLMIYLGLLGNVLYQNLFIFGLEHTRAGTASVLLAGSPMVTALLSAKLGHERVKPLAWVGIFIAFAGIAFVVLTGGSKGDGAGTDSLLGDALLLAATVAWACYTVGGQGLVARHGPVVVSGVGLWAGTIGLLIIGAPALMRVDFRSLSTATYLAILYAGALSIGFAYILWYYGTRVLGNTRGSAFSNLTPVVALLAAWPVVGETPRLWQFAGAAVILGGVMLTQFARVVQRDDDVSEPATP
ncbi:MAG: DMT family transporter [Longimicrobiales bacterium]